MIFNSKGLGERENERMKGRKRKKVSEARNVGNVGGHTGHRQMERRRKEWVIVLVGERRLERGGVGGEVKLVHVPKVHVTLFSSLSSLSP